LIDLAESTDQKPWEMPFSTRIGLMLQGKPEKGAKLLDSREDLDQLGNDARAYYALIISACGRGDEARRFAKAVDRQQLLPKLRTSLAQVIGSVSASADVSPKQF
jgi:hypothetical protein